MIFKYKDYLLKLILKNKLIFFLFFISLFLRLYRLEEFATFLADQGRDAIIIKQILTLQHLTAIGAPTSIGQIYDGPFYYYFIAPWLLIFKYNPVGLAFGVAFFSSLYILINYFIVKEVINRKVALISSIFITFSSTLVESSRFSWNPNLLPLFTLLAFYFLYKSLKNNQWYFFILTGAFISFAIQLHYLALFLIPASAILLIVNFFKNLKEIKRRIIMYLLMFFSFLLFSLPLLIFDLRHNFINSMSFIKLFQESTPISNSKIDNLLSTFNYLNTYAFHIQVNTIATFLFLILICGLLIFFISKKNNIKYFLFFFLILFIGVSLYAGPKHAHYFGAVYPLYYIIIAYFLSFLFSQRLAIILLTFIIGFYISSNFKGYNFFYNSGNNQILHAQKVAQFLNQVIDDKFSFAVQPDSWQEETYLYFLDLYGKKPADRKKLEVGNQMYVVCGTPCNLNTTKSWNINMFGRFKIVNEWEVDSVRIYKLVHAI